MKKSWQLILLVFLLALGIGVLNYRESEERQQSLFVGGKVVQVEIAQDQKTREKGLSERKTLCSNCGLLFLFEELGIYPFWMRKMYFDIDILWIDNNRVVDITYGAKRPPKEEFDAPRTIYQSQVPVDKVLEVNAGWVEKNGVKVGDEVVISKDKR